MPQSPRKGLVAFCALSMLVACVSRQFNPVAAIRQATTPEPPPRAGIAESPEGFLAGLLAAPGTAPRLAAGEELARAIDATFSAAVNATVGAEGAAGAEASLSNEQKLTRKILLATADYMRAPAACEETRKVTLYVGFNDAPLVRLPLAALAESVFLIPGWQEDFTRNGPQALRGVPSTLGEGLRAGSGGDALNWAVLAGKTTRTSQETALLWASLDPLVAEIKGNSVVAARVCPQRLMLAIDSDGLPTFNAYVPLFLLPEEIEEVGNGISDAFVEASGSRPTDRRYRATYIHFPADGEILQKALDGREEPPLTMSEVAFEKIKADFYGKLLAAQDGTAFSDLVGQGKVPLATTDCASLADSWNEFQQDTSKPGETNRWESEGALAKYKDRYRAFAKTEGNCTLP